MNRRRVFIAVMVTVVLTLSIIVGSMSNFLKSNMTSSNHTVIHDYVNPVIKNNLETLNTESNENTASTENKAEKEEVAVNQEKKEVQKVEIKKKSTPKKKKKKKQIDSKNKYKAKKKMIKSSKKYVGTFKIYAYCPCTKCCGKNANGHTASGTKATEGRTIAVDPKVIPLGSTVYIEYSGEQHKFIAEDTGGHWIQGYKIDKYMDSHSACYTWGVRTCKVWVEAS